MSFALLEYGIIGEEALDAINAQFDDFDTDGNGQVTKEEICERYTILREAQATEFNERVVNRASVAMGIGSILHHVPVPTSGPTSRSREVESTSLHLSITQVIATQVLRKWHQRQKN